MSTPPAPTGTAAPAATARGVPTVVMAGRTTTVVAQFSTVAPPPVVPLKITITQPAADRPHASAVKVEGDDSPFVLKGFIEGPVPYYDCFFVLYTNAPEYSAKYLLSVSKKVKLKKEFTEKINLTKLTALDGKIESLTKGRYFIALFACPSDTTPPYIDKLSDADPHTRAIREIEIIAAPPAADGVLRITCAVKPKSALSRKITVNDAEVMVVDSRGHAQTQKVDAKGTVEFILAPGPLAQLHAASPSFGSRSVVKPEDIVVPSKKILAKELEFPPHATVNLKAKIETSRKKAEVKWKLINKTGITIYETSSPTSEESISVLEGEYVVSVTSLEYEIVRFEPDVKITVKSGESTDVLVFVREKSLPVTTKITFLPTQVRIAGKQSTLTQESPSTELGAKVEYVFLPRSKPLLASLNFDVTAQATNNVKIYAKLASLSTRGISTEIPGAVRESLGIELRIHSTDKNKKASSSENSPLQIEMTESGSVGAALEFTMQATSLEKCQSYAPDINSLLLTCDVIVTDSKSTTTQAEKCSLIIQLEPADEEPPKPDEVPATTTEESIPPALPKDIPDEGKAIEQAIMNFGKFKSKVKADDRSETGWFSVEEVR